MKRLAFALLALLFASSEAAAQSSPNFSYGQVPTAKQWNDAFSSKQDRLTFAPLNPAGGTMQGRLQTAPSTVNAAGLSILPGTAPNAPSNGDLWATTVGLYSRVGGRTLAIPGLDQATGALLVPNGPTLGTYQNGQFTSQPYKIQIQGPGSTGPVDQMSTTAPDGSAIARSLSTRLRDLPVYPQDYGAQCVGGAGGSNDTAAYQTAANIAVATGRPLHLGGAGLCVTTAPITISKPISVLGDGESTCTIVGLHNGPILTFTANAASPSGASVAGCTFRHQSSAPSDYSATRAIKVTGSNYFTFPRFRDITAQGFYAAFEIDAGTHVTSFGNENNSAWNAWTNITVLSGARNAHYGWYYPNGSGTGNTYTNIKTGLSDADSAVFRYEGNGAVVGDILINQCHCAGNTSAVGASLVSVGPGTVYRSSISVLNSQIDSGMGNVFDFDPTGVPYRYVSLVGTNVASGATINKNGALLLNSNIVPSTSNDAKEGVFKQVSASANLVVPLFSVKVGAASDTLPFAAASCDITVSGVMPGFGAVVTKNNVAVLNNNGTASTTIGTATKSASASFDVSATVSGSTATINAVFPSGTASGGTSFDGQIRCTGGAAMSLAPL